MSSLRRPTTVVVAEPTLLDTEEHEELESYEPMHPLLAQLDAIHSVRASQPDHLQKYVEVDPFAPKEQKAEETAVEETAVEETAVEEKE